MTAEQAALYDFLTATVETIRRGSGRADLHYASIEDFVLQHGEWFNTLATHRYKRGTITMCFNNAYRRAAQSRGALTYVEGFAHSRILPVLHAWCVNRAGQVVEVTWPWPGTAYLGVPFDINVVRAHRARSKSASLLDDWPNRFPLLQEPYKATPGGGEHGTTTRSAGKHRGRAGARRAHPG